MTASQGRPLANLSVLDPTSSVDLREVAIFLE